MSEKKKESATKEPFSVKINPEVKKHFGVIAGALGKSVNRAVEEAMEEYIIRHKEEVNTAVKDTIEWAKSRQGK